MGGGGHDDGRHTVLAGPSVQPEDVEPDADFVTELLALQEPEAVPLFHELEAAKYIAGAVGPIQ